MTSAPIERERDPFRASRSSPRVRWRLLPWWGRSRSCTSPHVTTFVLALASVQRREPVDGGAARYFEYANMWDARWYQIVWLAGYPADPPLTGGGQVAENAWRSSRRIPRSSAC